MLNAVRLVGRTGRLLLSPDRKLAGDFVRGTDGSFERIYERYRRPLLRMILRSISDPRLAEDVLQEVFLKVHRFREKYDPSYELSTWLWTITRNTIADQHTRKPATAAADDFDIHEIPCPRHCAESSAIRKSERRRILQIALRLPRMQRRALALRVFEGLSYEEIAARMKLSLSAVKSLLNRGKSSLREQLEADPALSALAAAL